MLRVRTWSLVLLAAVAAGCGESERVEYERDLAGVGRIVEESLEALPRDPTTAIGPEHVARLADDVRDARRELSALRPPEEAEDAQARLERGLRGVATAFDELAADLEAAQTDAQKGEVFVNFATDERVDAAFEDLVAAQEAYDANGYRLFGRAGADGKTPLSER